MIAYFLVPSRPIASGFGLELSADGETGIGVMYSFLPPRSFLSSTSFCNTTEKTMSLLISDEIVRASGLSEADLLLEIMVLLFQQEKISLGKASELLGMSQIRFQRLLAARGICVHYWAIHQLL